MTARGPASRDRVSRFYRGLDGPLGRRAGPRRAAGGAGPGTDPGPPTSRRPWPDGFPRVGRRPRAGIASWAIRSPHLINVTLCVAWCNVDLLVGIPVIDSARARRAD